MECAGKLGKIKLQFVYIPKKLCYLGMNSEIVRFKSCIKDSEIEGWAKLVLVKTGIFLKMLVKKSKLFLSEPKGGKQIG